MKLVCLALVFLCCKVHGGCLSADHVGGGFSLGVTSRRNTSGFWITEVDVISGEKLQTWSKTKKTEVEFSISQDVIFCQESEKMKLSARVSNRGFEPPKDYNIVNGLGYYKLYTNVSSWESARIACEKDGAHLIIINSDEEAAVVKELSARYSVEPLQEADKYAFVGVHNRYPDKIYRTLYDIPLTSCCYNKWAPSNPKGFKDLFCIVMDRNAQYHDTHCNRASYFFICEYP